MKTLLRVAVLAVLPAAACRPEPPSPDRPPVPRAASPGELRDAIKAPQDKARAVQDTLQRAADEERAQIDAAEQ